MSTINIQEKDRKWITTQSKREWQEHTKLPYLTADVSLAVLSVNSSPIASSLLSSIPCQWQNQVSLITVTYWSLHAFTWVQSRTYASDKFELKYHDIFESFDFFLWCSVLIQFLLYGLCYCWKRAEKEAIQDLSKSTNTLNAPPPVSFSAINRFKFSIHYDLIPMPRIPELSDNNISVWIFILLWFTNSLV